MSCVPFSLLPNPLVEGAIIDDVLGRFRPLDPAAFDRGHKFGPIVDIGMILIPVGNKAGACRGAKVRPGWAPSIPGGSVGGWGAGEKIPAWLRKEYIPPGENPVCGWCRHNPATGLDHVDARIGGGDLTPENLVPACGRCNSSKGPRPTPKTPPPGYRGPWPAPWWPDWAIEWWNRTYR
jgi:HNH endonuclease